MVRDEGDNIQDVWETYLDLVVEKSSDFSINSRLFGTTCNSIKYYNMRML